ncbi:hypothetical protein [Haloarcula brevis]|uniref:hypothetical protein n=1 Tax=Haloarcula brevis TaxID=3111453 RepID=UPI00300F3E0F
MQDSSPVTLLHEFEAPESGYIALDTFKPIHVSRDDAPAIRLDGRGLHTDDVFIISMYKETETVTREMLARLDVEPHKEQTGQDMDGEEATVFWVRADYDDLVPPLVETGLTVGVHVDLLRLLASQEATFL